jgi:hypothetical protein
MSIIEVIYLTEYYDYEQTIKIELKKKFNFNGIKFDGFNIDNHNNFKVYVEYILNEIKNQISSDKYFLLYDNQIIYISLNEFNYSLKTIDTILIKLNKLIKEINQNNNLMVLNDNYKINIIKRYISYIKKDINKILKLLELENIVNNDFVSKFNSDIDKIALNMFNFISNSNDKFKKDYLTIINNFKLDIIQNYYTKEIINVMKINKELKIQKLKINQQKQFDIIDKHFFLLDKLICN